MIIRGDTMCTITAISPKKNAIEKIEYYISSNNLQEHDRLPAERELSQMWNISRTTIRSAVEFLVGKGTVYKIENTGVFVSPIKHTRNIIGVNTLTRNLREIGIRYSTRILSFRTIAADKRVAEKLNVKLNHKVYELIRLRSLQSLPCFIETIYLDSERCPNLEKYYTKKSSLYSIYQNVYKLRLVGGNEHISVTYATSAESDLLEISEKNPLFFTSGITYTKDEIPLEYYKIIFRSDQFRFVYMIEDKEYKRGDL